MAVLTSIDLRRLRGADAPPVQSFLDKLRPGSSIALVTTVRGAELHTNGFVSAVEPTSMWATLPRLHKVPSRLGARPRTYIALPPASHIDREDLRPGRFIDLVEMYRLHGSHRQAGSCMVSGQITQVEREGFRIEDYWIDLGPWHSPTLTRGRFRTS
jgi:hypothetical protein